MDRLRFSEPVVAVAVSPDGRLLAVQRLRENASDAHVEVRDLGSEQTVRTHTLRFGGGDLAFTPDGKLLVATGCCDGGTTLVGWDARSGARRFEIREDISTFAVSADSRLMAVGTVDGRVGLRDAHTGAPRGPATKVADGPISQLDFSPDGRLLASGAAGGSATVWDVRTRTRVGDEFPVVKGMIPAVAFEPNGRLLITEFVTAIEWPLDRPTLQRHACQVAGRELTREEWNDLLPNRPYRKVCGQ